LGEFRKRARDAPVLACADAEFVLTAANVLHERVTAHDHTSGVVSFESAHRSEPGFEGASEMSGV
jgi:hypothetical protein